MNSRGAVELGSGAARPDTLLIITTSYPEQGDGSEAAGAFVADIARELARFQPVRVVAPGSAPGEEPARDGVTIRRFASPGRPLSLLSPLSPGDWPAIMRTMASLRAETLAAASDGRVVHALALWALPSGWAARVLQRRFGVPYSVWVLGSDIWSLGRLPMVRSMLRGVMAGARYRFSDGLMLGEDAARIAGKPFEFLPSTRKLDIPVRADFSDGPPYRFLYLGRWHHNKGIDILLDALESLPDDDWERISEVHVAGGGPLGGRVRASVAALQARGRPVRLSGFLGREDAILALQEADYLVIPSRIESIPLVFSDALQAGCAVVTTPVGDLPRFFTDAPPGILADSVDALAIAKAIQRALQKKPGLFAEAIALAADQFSLAGRIVPRLRALSGE